MKGRSSTEQSEHVFSPQQSCAPCSASRGGVMLLAFANHHSTPSSAGGVQQEHLLHWRNTEPADRTCS
eukprot:2176447-Amphidinium_carterae.1